MLAKEGTLGVIAGFYSVLFPFPVFTPNEMKNQYGVLCVCPPFTSCGMRKAHAWLICHSVLRHARGTSESDFEPVVLTVEYKPATQPGVCFDPRR